MYHSKQAAEKSSTASSTSAAPTAPQPEPNQKYLVICEWGIELPVAAEASYSYKLSETQKAVHIVMPDMAAQYGCKDISSAIGRTPGTDYVSDKHKTVAQLYAANLSSVTKVGDYYYNYAFFPDDCNASVLSSPEVVARANGVLKAMLAGARSID